MTDHETKLMLWNATHLPVLTVCPYCLYLWIRRRDFPLGKLFTDVWLVGRSLGGVSFVSLYVWVERRFLTVWVCQWRVRMCDVWPAGCAEPSWRALGGKSPLSCSRTFPSIINPPDPSEGEWEWMSGRPKPQCLFQSITPNISTGCVCVMGKVGLGVFFWCVCASLVTTQSTCWVLNWNHNPQLEAKFTTCVFLCVKYATAGFTSTKCILWLPIVFLSLLHLHLL